MTVPPFVRTSPTSREAALSVHHAAPSLRAVVLATLQEHGPLTDEQIAVLSGLSQNTVRPRRGELVRDGYVAPAGAALTTSGRAAVRWAAVAGSERAASA